MLKYKIMALYIISQVLMGLGMTIDLSSRIMKSKKFILVYMTLASVFYVSSYLCQNSPLPAVANACNLVRGISYLYLDKKAMPFKYYLIPMAIIFCGFGVAIGFLWRDNMDIIMIISILLCTICLAFKNLLVVRIGLIANSSIWIAYNAYIASYVGVACNVLNIIFVIAAIISYHVILPKKQATLNNNEKTETITSQTDEQTIKNLDQKQNNDETDKKETER